MPDKQRLTCPICSSPFFNIFPAGECQACKQLVCGHCIQHDHPDHDTSICQSCVFKGTPYGQLSEMTVDELCSILASEAPQKSEIAATLLAEKEDLSAVTPLCLALDSRLTGVRRESAKSLAKLGSKEAIPFLEKGLADPEPAVRSYCIAGLARLEAYDALPKINGLLDDPSKQVAGHAVHALATLMNNEAVGLISDLVMNHPVPFVRCEALLALSRLQPDAALDPALTCLRDTEKSVQISALKILGKLKNPESIPNLMALLDADPPATVRINATAVLKQLRDDT